jgi:hypothetical protein
MNALALHGITVAVQNSNLYCRRSLSLKVKNGKLEIEGRVTQYFHHVQITNWFRKAVGSSNFILKVDVKSS